MRLKLYRAATTAQAMGRVRAELGADALILGTRRVADGVEVTAALEPDAPPPPRRPAADPGLRAALTFHGVPAPLCERLQAAALPEGLAAALRFAGLPLGRGAPPLLFAGPPGAGKTLTVARLATRLVMEGIVPLIVTADERRAGAVEQLGALTRLLGLELEVASHPVALVRTVARRPKGMPVLLDLPGSDPFQPGEQAELAALTSALGAVLVAVLPAGLDVAESADLADAYREAGAEHLVATRIDCARRLGGVVAAATRLACAELGIGPGAADGLVPATPDLLADWLTRKAPPDPPPLPRRDAAQPDPIA
jgi:flagellar biosynthesis protein FlhF